MKLAFIYPPYHGTDNAPSIRRVADNYGVFPPINLAYVASVSRNAGHEICFIDANAENLTKKETVKRLKEFNPDAVLFTITTYLFYQTLDWIKYIKKSTPSLIIVGGVHVSLYPKETLTHKEIDYAIIGDCEKTLPLLLKKIEMKKEVNNVENICFRDNKKIIITGNGLDSNFLRGVYPVRDLLQNDKYYSFISQRKNFTGMMSSKGCPFRCNYCEQGSKNSYFARETDDVINEIKECYYDYNIREIDFFDPIFTLKKDRTIQLCNEIKKLNINMEYAIRTRTDSVDDDILKALKDSGCKRIYFGIESSDKNILKKFNKKIDLKNLNKILNKTKEHDIDTFGFFMFGNPGETIKQIRNTAKFSRSLNLDYVQYNKTTVFAGTKMYEEIKLLSGYDYWAEFTKKENLKDMKLPSAQTKLTDKDSKRDSESIQTFLF